MKPDIVFVQETKLESLNRITAQRLWGGGNMEFMFSNSVGASGGLLIMWRKSFFTISNVIIQRYFIVLQGRVGDFECSLVNVYAPNDEAQRRVMWGDLAAIKGTTQEPWCLEETSTKSKL